VSTLALSGMVKMRSHFSLIALCLAEDIDSESQILDYDNAENNNNVFDNGSENYSGAINFKNTNVDNSSSTLSESVQILIEALSREGNALYNMLAETIVSLATGEYMKRRVGDDYDKDKVDENDISANNSNFSSQLSLHLSPSFFVGLSSSSFQKIVEYLIRVASLNEKQVESVGDRIIRAIRSCSSLLLKKPLNTADDDNNSPTPLPFPSNSPSPSITPLFPSSSSFLPSSSSLRLLSLALYLLPWGDRSSRPFTTAIIHPTLFCLFF
jgi:hypothetical protein